MGAPDRHIRTIAMSLVAQPRRVTGLRDGYMVEYLLDQVVGRVLFRLGFVARDEPMPQHVRPDSFHVLRGDVAAPLQERIRLGAEGERDGGPRRGAIFD